MRENAFHYRLRNGSASSVATCDKVILKVNSIFIDEDLESTLYAKLRLHTTQRVSVHSVEISR